MPTVVVVDDEEDILDLYKNILGEEYNVVAYNSPQLFLDDVVSGKLSSIDVAITDFKMPKLDGLSMIRKAQDSGISFPFILLSGYLDKQVVMDAVNVGVFRLLEKPTEFKILQTAIDELLVEHEIFNVRKEIRDITSQLRELYSTIRFALLQYIPQDVIDRMVVETGPTGKVKAKMSFEVLLEQLEARLDTLLSSEKVMVELKTNKFKS